MMRPGGVEKLCVAGVGETQDSLVPDDLRILATLLSRTLRRHFRWVAPARHPRSLIGDTAEIEGAIADLSEQAFDRNELAL